jgi:hypothetical protein
MHKQVKLLTAVMALNLIQITSIIGMDISKDEFTILNEVINKTNKQIKLTINDQEKTYKIGNNLARKICSEGPARQEYR